MFWIQSCQFFKKETYTLKITISCNHSHMIKKKDEAKLFKTLLQLFSEMSSLFSSCQGFVIEVEQGKFALNPTFLHLPKAALLKCIFITPCAVLIIYISKLLDPDRLFFLE